MFTTQAISHAEPSVSISRRRTPILAVWAALLALGLTALVLAVTVGHGTGSSSPSSSAATPQVRDTPPSPAAAAQIARASVPAGYVRDPSTHGLLKIQTGTGGQAGSTNVQDIPPALRGLVATRKGR